MKFTNYTLNALNEIMSKSKDKELVELAKTEYYRRLALIVNKGGLR